MHKIWHRKFDGWWYVTLRENGRRKQIKLVKAPPGKDGRKLAFEQLTRELAARDMVDETTASPSWVTVEHVVQGFLAHSKAEHEPESFRWYRTILNSFVAKWGSLRVTLLRKKHVQAWLKKTAYNPTSQNKAIGVVKRAFNWAVEEEHIQRNPIAHVRKPTQLTRDRTLTPAEKDLIFRSVRDQAFRDYLTGLTLTGCRPGEVARVTREDVGLDHGVWILTKHKTAKKTGKPRVVYLCPEAVELTRRLLVKNPDGPIFRNRIGQPWSRNAVRIRFRRLRKRHPELKGVVAYTFRSTFATDALERGIPDTTVSALLGHTNTQTLHKHYARLSHRINHLRDAARQATQRPEGGDEAAPGIPA